MGDELTTFGSDPERLARLLDIGAGEGAEGKAECEQAKADLLRVRLAGTLPLKKRVVRDLPAILGRLRDDLLPLGGKPLGEVLLDKECSLKMLQTIKEYGKQLAAGSDREVEHAVGIAIYFAAIASALLFHDERITSYSYPALAQSFGTLINRRWLTGQLDRHFAKARRICKKKAK